MEPGRYDVSIRRGETWEEVWTWTDDDDVPYDVTAYSASLELRTKPNSADPAALRLTSTPAAGLTLGGALGTFTVHATSAQTAALVERVYFWDLRIDDGAGNIQYLLGGKATVVESVTES